MDLAKCVNRQCGKILHPEDEVFQVLQIDGDGFQTLAVACCPECAKAAKDANMTIHQRRLLEVRNYAPKKIMLRDF